MLITCGKIQNKKLGRKEKRNYLYYMKIKTYYFTIRTNERTIIDYWLDAKNEKEAWSELILILNTIYKEEQIKSIIFEYEKIN